MTDAHVALVCVEDRLRMAVAQAFDEAPAEWQVTLHRNIPAAADVVVTVGCELPDAVPFDPDQPHLVLDDVKRRLEICKRKLITVVGATGGCGATSVALHLAAEAARPTCLVGSADPGIVAQRLGVEAAAVGATPIPVAGGFRLAAAGEVELTPLVSRLAGMFEIVLVDAARTAFAELAARSHAVVVVVAPTVPSAHAASELLLSAPDARCALVTNRVGPGGETGSAELQRILGGRICLELPCSRSLRDAEGESRLVSSWSLWRRRLGRLARALEL